MATVLKTFMVVLLVSTSPMLASVSADETEGVVRVDGARVKAAFAKGMPLVENDELKVHASRRDTGGQAEVHERDTDIFYVLEGSAELVTGGELVRETNVAAGEIRADAIEGGQSRRIGPGDVIVVRRGVPHWFRSVDEPMTYYVVKVSGDPE